MLCPRITTRPGGPKLSRIVAGMWRLADWKMDAQARAAFIESCVEIGVTTFDHADIYGDYGVETLFGEALDLAPALKQRIELVSKCGIMLTSGQRPQHRLKYYDTSAAHITASVEASLRNLRVDHLDLLLIHRPDPLMNYDEIAGAFEALRAAGKVLHFGVSNFTQVQFDALNARIELATNQVEFSPLHLDPAENGQFDAMQDQGVAPMIWSALGGGRLFDTDPKSMQLRQVLEQTAKTLGVSMATVIYAWILRLPCRAIPLTGSGRFEVVKDAVAATGLTLDRQTWFDILKAARGHDIA